MIWLAFGMGVTFFAGYKAAAEYTAISPSVAAAKGFAKLFRKPAGPSSAATNQGTPEQSQ